MDESSFEGCSVIFHNVLEWYKPDQTIPCQFSIKDQTFLDKQENDCFVGIFHVGWDSLGASITRKNLSLVESVSERSFQVDFLGQELPDSNPDEFYQFCFYNIKTEVVYGASCPFQICNRGDANEPFVVCGNSPIQTKGGKTTSDPTTTASAKDEDNKESLTVWMEKNQIEISDDIDEDFDTVMVVKKKNFAEENLAKITLEHEILLKKTKNMETESSKSATEINQLQHNIEMKDRRAQILEESIKESEKVIKHLNTQMRDMKEEIVRDYEAKLKEVSTRIEELESSRSKANLENSLLKTELKEKEDKMSAEINHLKNALDVEKNSCRLLEDEHKNVLEKFGEIKDAHGKGIEEAKEIEARLIETSSHLKLERQKNLVLLGQLDNVTEAVEILKKELKANETAHMEKEKALRESVSTMTNQLYSLQNQNNEFCNTIDQLNEREGMQTTTHKNYVAELENQIAMLQVEIEDLSSTKDKEIAELNGFMELQTTNINECNTQAESVQAELEEKKAEIAVMKESFENQNGETQRVIEDLRSKVEELQEQIELQEIKPTTMNKAEGSYYALQVAYSFIQKQLKQFKTENEELRKLVQPVLEDGATVPLIKENDDMKLRLQFGKQAYDQQFKECQKLKTELSLLKKKQPSQEVAINAEVIESKHIDENNSLLSEIVVLKEELKKREDEETDLLMKIEQEKSKSKQYDDNFKLLKEENMLLKTQVSALLEGGTTATLRRKFDPNTSSSVVYQPPSCSKPEIAYPPSMNKIDRDNNAAWLPQAARQFNLPSQPHNQAAASPPSRRPPQGMLPIWANDSLVASNPPSIQMIPNRHNQQHQMKHTTPVPSLTLHGRGSPSGGGAVGNPRKQQRTPASRCPVCQFDFPPGFSEVSASNHVNGHFQE